MQQRYGSMGLKAFLITFICIVAAACVIAGITYSLELWGGKTVPYVVGMTQAQAKDALAERGFASNVEKVGSDEQKGTVLGTDPEAGTRADDGFEITIYVAKAKTVPNVVGSMVDDAKALLGENGYNNVEVVEKASDEEAGKVLSQDPSANSAAKTDALISLTVATPHLVPNVNGMPEAEAKSVIANEGYKYFVTQIYTDDAQEGTVVETSPEAGSACPLSKTIEIKVAKSRSKELTDIARRYLESLSKVRINGKSYEISQIDDVSYDNGSTCRFTLTVRPFESHSWFGGEPDVRYGNYEKISGSVTVNDKNEVESSDPYMEAL